MALEQSSALAPGPAPQPVLARARRLTVVVPTFNEAENLESLVWALLGLKIPGVRLSVLVVDDNSPDGTGAIADDLAARHGPRVAVLHRPTREGLGRAYVQAFGLALEQGADLVVQMDADHSHDPAAIPSLLAALPGADVVLGSRFVPGSRIDADWPRSRRLLAWFANSVYVRLLLGSRLQDMTGGFRLWRADTLRAMDLAHDIRSAGFVFQVEMVHVAQQLGFRAREVPITFSDRVAGKSKMSLRIQLEAAWRAWELKWRYRKTAPLEHPSAGQREVAQAAEARARRRPNVWQQRYLLRHYHSFGDVALADGAGLNVPVVAEFLQRRGATRSTGDLKRIEQRGSAAPPAIVTPATARRAVTRLSTRPLAPLDFALVAGLFVASLLLYGVTAARRVTGEDAGELLAAAHGFGVPHPPGYPLWLVLSWMADHVLPWGSVAWRVSLVSAVPSAAANAVLLVVALKTLRHRLAAVTAAALFAVSLTHWTQAVIPEVYGLNTLFVAAQALLLIGLAEHPSRTRLVSLAAVTGLSATNHTSALPLGAVVGFAAILIAPQLLRSPRTVVLALLAGVLPLALYLVLPWASARQPYMDWGNPETLDSLWRHATRAQYTEVEAGKLATFHHADYLRRLSILADWAARQFGSGWVLLLAALGAVPLLLRQTGPWLLLVTIGWLSSVGITRYTSFAFEREHIYANQIFWIPAWLVLAWLMGGGLDVVAGWLAAPRQALARRAGGAALALGCAALVAIPTVDHYARADRSRTTFIEGFGRAILDAMEPGALYFPSSDHSTFPVLYLQGVEGYRLDVIVADKTGEVDKAVIERTLTSEDKALLARTAKPTSREAVERLLIQRWSGPVYFANRRDMRDVEGRVLEPVGPVFKVMTPEEATAWWAEGADGATPPGLAAWDGVLPVLTVDERQRLDFTVQMMHADLLHMRGFAQIRAGDMDGALATWNQMRGDLAPLKQMFNNVGSALAENGRPEQALDFYERAVAEDDRYLIGLRNKALVLKGLGRTEEFIAALRQVVEVDPEQRDARLELARALVDAKRHGEALATYEGLAQADRDDPVPFREGGRLMLELGDSAKARVLLQHAHELEPDREDVAQWLDQIAQGQVALDPALPPLTGPAAAPWMPADGARGLGAGLPMVPGLPQDPALRLRFDPGLKTPPRR